LPAAVGGGSRQACRQVDGADRFYFVVIFINDWQTGTLARHMYRKNGLTH
jgi:hypothetical protein